jgi:Family of unknown function (DUF6731)
MLFRSGCHLCKEPAQVNQGRNLVPPPILFSSPLVQKWSIGYANGIVKWGNKALDKKLSVRFFRVASARGTPPLTTTLAAIRQKPIKDRLVTVHDLQVRLERLDQIRGRSYGDFVRLQNDNKPGMASPATEEEPLGVPPTHGLTHTAAFGFDPNLGILGMQVNRSGLSQTNLSAYLGDFISVCGYSFLAVARKNVLSQAQQISIKRVDLRVAAPDDLSEVDDDTRSAKDALRHMRELFGGKMVSVSISVGHHKSRLKQGTVKKTLRWLHKNAVDGSGSVEALRIMGVASDDDEKSRVVLDLLGDLIVYRDKMILSDTDMAKNYAARRSLIERAFDSYKQELAVYKVNGTQ